MQPVSHGVEFIVFSVFLMKYPTTLGSKNIFAKITISHNKNL
jgi:hypothetical protein